MCAVYVTMFHHWFVTHPLYGYSPLIFHTASNKNLGVGKAGSEANPHNSKDRDTKPQSWSTDEQLTISSFHLSESDESSVGTKGSRYTRIGR